MATQPIVTAVEVNALRCELAAVKEKLESQKVYYEAQITVLTRQRDSFEKQLKSCQSATPPPKVIAKKPR